MEKPEEDPINSQPCAQIPSNQNPAPIYRVSPQLFVTKEHIMSESASTSSSDFSEIVLFLLSAFLLFGSGDAKVLRGVDPLPSFGVLCEGEVGCEPGASDCLCDSLFSASRFSRVPKSVRPLSSSVSNPGIH
jgi:hypothetical protein